MRLELVTVPFDIGEKRWRPRLVLCKAKAGLIC